MGERLSLLLGTRQYGRTPFGYSYSLTPNECLVFSPAEPILLNHCGSLGYYDMMVIRNYKIEMLTIFSAFPTIFSNAYLDPGS
jgi:hypothetical protein